jgi:TatD DNase family protein
MKYIDIHCHLDFKDYDLVREEVLARMKEKDLGAITIGADLESSKRAVEIAEESEKTGNKIWACVGVHPEDVSLFFDQNEFEILIKSEKVVGIGECGLDYSRPEWKEREKDQKILFEKQIQFALKYNKPLMLHIRSSGKNNFDAYEDALDILKNYKEAGGPKAAKLRGNVHFFAGSIPIVKRFLDLEFTTSFTGVVTFTHDYDEVVKYIPQNSIMSETDAPFVAPLPFRGKRNEPIFVAEVVKKLALIREENINILNNVLINNAKRIFGIGDIIHTIE